MSCDARHPGKKSRVAQVPREKAGNVEAETKAELPDVEVRSGYFLSLISLRSLLEF
jgi:hypothetical protein